MDIFKKFKSPFTETVLIALILLTGDLINYFLYSRASFYNILYLAAVLAGLGLSRRKQYLWIFLGAFSLWIGYLLLQMNRVAQPGNFDFYFNLSIWIGFLVVTGCLIGNTLGRLEKERRKKDEIQTEYDAERESHRKTQEILDAHDSVTRATLDEKTREFEEAYTQVKTVKDKMEKALNSIMDPTAVQMMLDGTLRNEKRRISVLFADLKDFTAYSDEYPPEKVVEELNQYLKEMEDCIQRFFGHIDKYIGDGIMAEFCTPLSYRLHALMAVVAGLTMQKRLLQINSPWKMRIGIATGLAVVGMFGSKRKSYSCIGSTPNTASRLENICEVGSIYIDEPTYNDVKQYVHAVRIHDLHGKRASDVHIKEKIYNLRRKADENPYDTETLFALGQAYFENRQASQAMECYEQIIRMDPDHIEAKLAFAESNIKRDEFEKLAIKGKKDRMAVYKVIGFTDPMENRKKIPENFYRKFHHVVSRMTFPEELVLRSELIDGSIHHGKMVAILSFALADKLGLSEKEKEDIFMAGYLHDIGKEAVPHDYLERTGKLTPDERNELNKHPLESVRMAKALGYDSENLLRIVETHHECYDGTGYPHGLKGEDIPIGSRILAIADTFDSMTSWRVYSEDPWEYKSSIVEIQKEAALGRFDPNCAQAFVELIME